MYQHVNQRIDFRKINYCIRLLLLVRVRWVNMLAPLLIWIAVQCYVASLGISTSGERKVRVDMISIDKSA